MQQYFHKKQHRGDMKRSSMITRLVGSKFIFAAVCVAGVAIWASCAPAVDTDAIARELTRLDDDWSKAAVAKDVDKVAWYYAADANVYPPNSPIVVGQAEAKKVWAAFLADSTFSISWNTLHAGASKSGDLGFTAGTYEDSFRGTDGSLVTEKGKYLCVWAKQSDGSWKAIHDMWNTDPK